MLKFNVQMLAAGMLLLMPSLFAQGPISIKMLQGGPLPPAVSLNITATGNWTAKSSNTDVVGLNKTSGTGNATITVVPISWQRPGTYKATITISGASAPMTIPFSMEVLSRAAPVITYGRKIGPQDCNDVPGFAPGNAALCTVPGEKPPGNFTPPGVGASYQDPNFGATVHVIGGPKSLHGYSTPSPINANSTYALISTNDKTLVVGLLTGKIVRENVPVGIEGSMWDAQDPKYLYGFSGAKIQRYDVTSGKTDTVANYSGKFKSVTPRGTGEISKDNWIPFNAPQENQVCALDVLNVKTYCAVLPAGFSVDFPTMAKGVDRTSGKRYLIVVGSGPFLIYSVNVAQARLDLEGRGPEDVLMEAGDHDGICETGETCIGGGHGDTMEDSHGNQFLVTAIEGQSPCEYSLYSVQLNRGAQMGLPVEFGGGLKRLMPMFRCGSDHWVDFHTGCAKKTPDCVVSITNEGFNEVRRPDDPTPIRRSPYVGEIVVVRDNGAEIRRLAQHRSIQFSNEEANGYWSNPRAAISAEGAYVIASSNFGVPNQHRVIVVETGLGAPR